MEPKTKHKIIIGLLAFFWLSPSLALPLFSESSDMRAESLTELETIIIDLSKKIEDYQQLATSYEKTTNNLKTITENYQTLETDYKKLEKNLKKEQGIKIGLAVLSGLALGSLVASVACLAAQ